MLIYRLQIKPFFCSFVSKKNFAKTIFFIQPSKYITICIRISQEIVQVPWCTFTNNLYVCCTMPYSNKNSLCSFFLVNFCLLYTNMLFCIKCLILSAIMFIIGIFLCCILYHYKNIVVCFFFIDTRTTLTMFIMDWK